MAYFNTLFEKNFLEYASYVIKDRAIPHIDDGLKPVQRRILHSLFEIDDGKFHKVANVVGHCMKYHPHGDASIYSALVVLANKEILIDRQGNFGNIFTGDQASASRYIECRILPFAKQVLHNPEITRYEPSYDGRNREPITLPAKLPLILVMGAEGIAVGMSTKILPHNIHEVIDAMVLALTKKKFQLFPDFPGGGFIDVADYEDGMGKVRVRAKMDTRDPKRIIIREIPYGTTTESLIASIENAARQNKIKISSINDYTTEHVEIEIKLARGVTTEDVVDSLYAFTDCEVSISVNLLVIKDNMPVQITVSEVIRHHAKQLVAILTQELKLEQKQLRDRLHARTLEQIFIEERIYKRIENKKTSEGVIKAVITGFEPFKSQIKREVTREDVERLLKIPIRRISLYDIEKAKKEMQEIRERLKEVAHHLKNIVDYAVDRLGDIKAAVPAGIQRRTEVKSFQKVDIREVAQRNLKLRYDEATGYLGYGISSGKVLFDVSDLDKVLIVRKGGLYSVVPVPEKIFVDKDMIHCCLADKDELEKYEYTYVYSQKDTKYPYIKRFLIDKYITGRSYDLLPEGAKLLCATVETKKGIKVEYKKKPKTRKISEVFAIADYEIKGQKAQGVRLAKREAVSARVSNAPRAKSSSVSTTAKKSRQ
jgi:topoisomerase-4 subunit A